MTEDEGAVARLFALLASIPTAEEGQPHARSLREAMRRKDLPSSLFSLSRPIAQELANTYSRVEPRLLSASRIPKPPVPTKAMLGVTLQVLAEVHDLVRSTIATLLNGQRAFISPIHLKGVYVELVDDVLRERPVALGSKGFLSSEFLQLLRRKPFPFARCSVCSRVFLKERRRRYCSPQCASRGVEVARKDARREYMRRYMAARRAKQRGRRTTSRSPA
jgi:hypothetical protein